MIAALMDPRNQKCKVYYDMILPKEFQSKGDIVYKLFDPKSLHAIPKHQCSHKMSRKIKMIPAPRPAPTGPPSLSW